MSELIIRSNGTYIEDPSGELIPVKVHCTRLDAPPSIDADHAVAAEREAIAEWLTSQITYDVREWEYRGHAYTETAASGFAAEPNAIIDAIRRGAPHASTPPAGQERG